MDDNPILPLTHCYVDLLRGSVIGPESTAQLSSKELALLTHLARRPGECVSRDQLHEVVWGYAPTVLSRAVDTAVARLRKKLREPPRAPDHLISVHGEGYRFVPLVKSVELSPPEEDAGPTLPLPDGRLELGARRVVRAGNVSAINDREAAILDVLHRHQGSFVPRRALLEAAWTQPSSLRVVDAALARLRAKLEVDPAHPVVLVSARGVGVRLEGLPQAQLPHDLGLFVGRDEELGRVLAAVEAHPLVTVTGTGGLGKTRLAVSAAHAMQSAGRRVIWVDLAGVSPHTSPGFAVARAAGVDAGSDDGAGAVDAALAGAVVILDNCEHVVAQLVPLLERWLPGTTVLATSRAPLGLAAEHRIPLAPLPHDASEGRAAGVEVFVARARQAHPGFRLGPENDATVRAIVAAVDGLPLAIELAAAQLATRSPAQLLEALAEEIGAAASGATLQATVRSSWDLLDPEDQRRLARVAVFRGGFALDAGEAVVGGDLGPFLDQGFLYRDDRRIRVYATTRAFLGGLGEPEPAAVRAHAAWYARLGRADVLDAVRCCGVEGVRFDGDAANLAAAIDAMVEAGDGELAAGCALGLLGLREPRGAEAATIDRAARVLALSLEPSLEARLRIWLGRVRRRRGEFLRAAADFRAAAALAVEAGSAQLRGRALAGLGWVRSDEHEAAASVALFREALELGTASNDEVGLAAAHVGVALGCVPLGDGPEARRHAQTALRIGRACGAARSQALALSVLGNLYRLDGAFADAIDAWTLSRQRLAQLGDRRREAATAQNLGLMRWYRGEYDEAQSLMEWALRTLNRLGLGAASVTNNLANVARARGDLAHARALLTEARGQTLGDASTTHWILTANLGRLDLLEGDLVSARQRLRSAADGMARFPTGAQAALAALAEVEARLGALDVARDLAHGALAHYAEHASPAGEATALLHAAVVLHLSGDPTGQGLLRRAAQGVRRLGVEAGELGQHLARVAAELGLESYSSTTAS